MGEMRRKRATPAQGSGRRKPKTDMGKEKGLEGPRRRQMGFACMECGHKFKTVKAAERASFGANGCPGCGGSDIDLAKYTPKAPPKTPQTVTS